MRLSLILIILSTVLFSGCMVSSISTVPQDEEGNVPVVLKDMVTPPFLVKANQVEGSVLLAVDTNMTTSPYNIIVEPGSNISIDHYIGIFNLVTDRFYVGVVLNVVGTNITLDTPLDSDFVTGNIVGFGITNWAVDGSITPQIFAIRGADPGLNITVDLTRLLFTCITESALQLTDFGDILGGLERGIVIRRVDGMTQNYVNFKTNIEMKGWMLDWENLDDTNPGQGLHGFVARLTLSGQEKLGVATRLKFGDELQIVIQDDLSSLISCELMAEGHQTK